VSTPPARDAGALADVIGRVLDDPARAAAVGEAGRASARALTWQANAGQTLKVYERVLAAAGRRDRR